MPPSAKMLVEGFVNRMYDASAHDRDNGEREWWISKLDVTRSGRHGQILNVTAHYDGRNRFDLEGFRQIGRIDLKTGRARIESIYHSSFDKIDSGWYRNVSVLLPAKHWRLEPQQHPYFVGKLGRDPYFLGTPITRPAAVPADWAGGE